MSPARYRFYTAELKATTIPEYFLQEIRNILEGISGKKKPEDS
jgi:hypothetical protein